MTRETNRDFRMASHTFESHGRLVCHKSNYDACVPTLCTYVTLLERDSHISKVKSVRRFRLSHEKFESCKQIKNWNGEKNHLTITKLNFPRVSNQSIKAMTEIQR